MRRWILILGVNIVLLIVFLGAAELTTRQVFTCSFPDRVMPYAFEPGVGVIYKPNEIVRDTNGFDYCTEQRSNRLGFLDSDPPAWDEIKDKLRIAIVGDSFVEATQVTRSEKVQHLLAQRLFSAGIDASVVGWGISGLGQVQELALFKRFGLALHPNVVVLVIVYNDLKNNSWLLQALEYGIPPDTPYNVEIRPSAEGWSTIAPFPIDDVHQLPRPPKPEPPLWATWLDKHSKLYRYLLYLTDWNYPSLHRLLSGVTPRDPIPGYIRSFSADPELAPLLVNWPVDATDIDDAFEHHPSPRAFNLAIAATEHVMDEWVALSRRENFKILALMSGEFDRMPAKSAIWQRILSERSIPAIWYAKAHDPDGSHFLRDGHWNAQGHRWAAEMIADFLTHHGDYMEATFRP